MIRYFEGHTMRDCFQYFAFVLVMFVCRPGWSQSVNLAEDTEKELAWVTPMIKASKVTFLTYDSEVIKTKYSFHIYQPAAYDRLP
ncbi:MAG: hypothetical protein RLY14_618, partial [Planctomycetota bacterium]